MKNIKYSMSPFSLKCLEKTHIDIIIGSVFAWDQEGVIGDWVKMNFERYFKDNKNVLTLDIFAHIYKFT